jgi:hypothetical protein
MKNYFETKNHSKAKSYFETRNYSKTTAHCLMTSYWRKNSRKAANYLMMT